MKFHALETVSDLKSCAYCVNTKHAILNGDSINMFSKFHLIYVLLIVGIIELPSAVTVEDDKHGDTKSHQLLDEGWDVRCRLQPNSWHCYKNRTTVHQFYYDVTMQSCKTFEYGGCNLNFNGFATLSDCSKACFGVDELTPTKILNLTTEVTCRLQHEFGSCNNYQPMYYYDVSTRTCKSFSYSGCGGNLNRFGSNHQCMAVCETAMPKFKLG